MHRLVSGTFGLFCLVGGGSAAAWPSSADAVLVIAAPWSEDGTALRAVAGAGGSLLSVGSGGRIVRARPIDPDFLARLRAAGPFLLIRTADTACGATGAST